MKLSLKNIGKIKEAVIEIKGITVIAGENNTGKSTVSKALFSVFNGISDIDYQIKREKAKSITSVINTILSENPLSSSQQIYNHVIGEYIIANYGSPKHGDISSSVLNALDRYNEMYDCKIEIESLSENSISRLSDVLSISDNEVFQKLLSHRIADEFNSQSNNIYSDEPGEITLTIKNNPFCIKIFNNEVRELSSILNLNTEAVYIDDPFIIDEVQPRLTKLGIRTYYDHRSNLKSKLKTGSRKPNIINEIITTNKFDVIFERIGLNFKENVFKSRRPFMELKGSGEDKSLNIKNLSTGIKTFLILKTLLTNETIQHNGTLILDEPEIHLHPEWQLLFAELIVLIQKEFGMHILLNTHSPYFLRAIQVYAAKHEVADKCKYYLSYLSENGAYIKDVSNDIEQIYKKLSLPFQKLDDTRWDSD